MAGGAGGGGGGSGSLLPGAGDAEPDGARGSDGVVGVGPEMDARVFTGAGGGPAAFGLAGVVPVTPGGGAGFGGGAITFDVDAARVSVAGGFAAAAEAAGAGDVGVVAAGG